MQACKHAGMRFLARTAAVGAQSVRSMRPYAFVDRTL